MLLGISYVSAWNVRLSLEEFPGQVPGKTLPEIFMGLVIKWERDSVGIFASLELMRDFLPRAALRLHVKQDVV